MDYSKYKIHHTRGKSDTNFYQEQNILNGAYSGLKVLRVSIVSDLAHTVSTYKKKHTQNHNNNQNQQKDNTKITQAYSNNVGNLNDSNVDDSVGERILLLTERVLLFKQELDDYFFGNKIHLLKFHLDNISAIIIKNISDLQNEIIKECPSLKNSHIIKILGNFSDIISTFIETKPQEFYKEIKDAILNQWDKNRIKIKELFEKIEQNCNICVKGEKEEMSFSIEHYELYHEVENKKRKDSDVFIQKKKTTKMTLDDNIKRLKRDEPATLYYLIKRKKGIMNFMTEMTHHILFSISRLYYDMDYYSIIISSLAFKIFYAIMYYIDAGKDKIDYLNDIEKLKQKKVFHLINHLIHLTLSFNMNLPTGTIFSENGGLNSLSKYTLNNFIEIVSKCKGLKIPKIIPPFKQPSLSQVRYKTKFYKCYLQRYKKYKDNSLLRIFMLYYNSKIIFWRSVMLVAKPKDNNKTFICRTCEKEIPLDEIFLHLGTCKEKQAFYDKMKIFKIKIHSYITHLELYLAKLKINPTKIKLFGKNGNLNKITTTIKGCENDDSGVNFITKLIKLYTFEKNKSYDFYEKKPEEISFVVSMSYFTLMIFLINKTSSDSDQDLNEILGGIFTILLQIFMNVEFLLYTKRSQTKTNMFKNKKGLHKVESDTKINNNYIVSNSKNVISKLGNNDDSSSEDDDFFNPELNFKSVIEKYKENLSLNNLMLIKKSSNSSKLKSNDRLGLSSHKNIDHIFLEENLNQDNQDNQDNKNNKKNHEKNSRDKYAFFNQKSCSSVFRHKKRGRGKTIKIASRKKVEEILRIFTEKITHRENKKNHSSSSHNSYDIRLNKDISLKAFKKINSVNYRASGVRSLKMTRNNSSGNILLSSKNEKEKDKSNDSSLIICASSNYNNSHHNIINSSMLSETESSGGDFEPIINKSNIEKVDENLSMVDSCLSRIDSNIHRIDSNISRVDSIDNNLNKGEEENNNNKDQKSIRFILNNDQNFQLGYRGEKDKRIINNNKLSLFGSTKKNSDKNIHKNIHSLSKSSHKDKEENKNKEKEMEVKQIPSSSDSDSSDSEDNNKSNKSKSSKLSNGNGKNILVQGYEEKDKNNNNIKVIGDENDNKEEKNNYDKKEFFNVFLEKNNKNDDDDDNNSEASNNIIIHSSVDSSDSKDDDFYESNKATTADFEDMLPNMLYIKPGNPNNLNYEQIASLFNKLMDDIGKRNSICYDRSNSFLNDTINKDKKSFLNKYDIDKITHNNSTNESTMKSKDFNDDFIINKTKDINFDEEKDETQKKISKFKLILPIAKGGYGSVGLYKNVATSDSYAIKTVDINSMKEKKLSSSLKNEQNILKEINNEYVVNSYFIFQDKKNYYFVMEYLPGGDVYTLLSKNNLPKKTIQLIVAETILAVNYLHSIHIIHHDIKPENILISLKGHFKLSDFGLSKTLQEDNEFDVVKKLKNFVEFNKFPINFNLGDDEDENKDAVGTLNYMAPELFTDKYPHGAGIDYWAIGVLIFDLYSYSLPFEAKTQEEMRSNIIGIKIDWSKLINDEIKKIYGNIDPAVDLIKKFLKENPEDRWGDKDLDKIKKHKFFEGFNWNDIQNIKNDTIKEYVKERVKENNNKIKQLNLKNKAKKEKEKEKEKGREKEKGERRTDNSKSEDIYPSVIEINMTENEQKNFIERLDNLNKKNKELIKKKIAKEVNIKENISDLMLFDLE